MKVLVACEFSGIVRDAFIAKGHDAVSCDLLPTESDGPHIQGDVLDYLHDDWDMMIAFPPCTYLCRQSNRWNVTPERQRGLQHSYDLWAALADAPIPRIALENPIPHREAKRRMGNYSQIIQPWQFGHDYSKKTCLWLKNLPRLMPTDVVTLTYYTTPNGRRYTRGWYFTPRNSIARSRTFSGIANAMAQQWG